MIAVVDRHADRGVVIGTAAAAGERGGFVHHDAIAARGKFDRCGQAGKPGADNMDGASHHSMIPKSEHRFSEKIMLKQ
jgi:hypothetical protein